MGRASLSSAGVPQWEHGTARRDLRPGLRLTEFASRTSITFHIAAHRRHRPHPHNGGVVRADETRISPMGKCLWQQPRECRITVWFGKLASSILGVRGRRPAGAGGSQLRAQFEAGTSEMNQGKEGKGLSLISISIDLGGSTATKQAIVENSTGDREHRAELYERYLRLLSTVEATFYFLIRHEPDLDLARLFLVKSIGDEFWWVYPVDRQDEVSLRRTAAALIEVLLATMEKSHGLAVPSRQLTPEEELDVNLDVQWTRFDLPLKGCVDLLDDATELNLKRFEILKDQIAALAQEIENDPERRNELIAKLYNNLNLGSTEMHGTKLRSAIRTDYVGLEVDRFFRIAKFCKPRMLAVGNTLLHALDHEIEPIDDTHAHLGVKVLTHRVPHKGGGGWTANRKHIISQALKADDLKGIGEPYILHHVFGLGSLGGAAFMPLAGTITLMEATRAFLGENAFYAIPPEKRLV